MNSVAAISVWALLIGMTPTVFCKDLILKSLPTEVFDDTTDGITRIELTELARFGAGGCWQIVKQSRQTVQFSCSTSESRLTLFFYDQERLVFAVETLNGDNSSIHLWKKVPSGDFKKSDVVSSISISDYFDAVDISNSTHAQSDCHLKNRYLIKCQFHSWMNAPTKNKKPNKEVFLSWSGQEVVKNQVLEMKIGVVYACEGDPDGFSLEKVSPHVLYLSTAAFEDDYFRIDEASTSQIIGEKVFEAFASAYKGKETKKFNGESKIYLNPSKIKGAFHAMVGNDSVKCKPCQSCVSINKK